MWIWSRDFPWVPEITNNFREKQTASLSSSLSHPPSFPFPHSPPPPQKKSTRKLGNGCSVSLKCIMILQVHCLDVFLAISTFKQKLLSLSYNNYPLNTLKDDCSFWRSQSSKHSHVWLVLVTWMLSFKSVRLFMSVNFTCIQASTSCFINP